MRVSGEGQALAGGGTVDQGRQGWNQGRQNGGQLQGEQKRELGYAYQLRDCAMASIG